MLKGNQASKAELIERATRWAAKRKFRFGKARLDEWIKQGLAFKGVRLQPMGRRQVYVFRARHYRRVLRLIRFSVTGIKDTDAILVQLFLRGYGAEPHEVREALRKEYKKARNSLNAAIRSTYADWSDIPRGRANQLQKRLGNPYRRLTKLNISPSQELLLFILRIARDPEARVPATFKMPTGFSFLNAPVVTLLRLFSGILAPDKAWATQLDKIITGSDHREYMQALAIFESIRATFGSLRALKQENFGALCSEVHAFFVAREMAPFWFVMALKMVASESIDIFFGSKNAAKSVQ